jgi:hypothetical protein
MPTKRVLLDEFEFNGGIVPARWASTLVGSAMVGINNGQVDLSLIATNEVESARLSFGDQLPYPISNILSMSFWAKLTASLPASVTVAMGLASAGNAAQTSIAARTLFRCVGSNSVVINTTDGVLTNSDIATGETLVNAFKKFTINFSEGTVTVGPPASQVGGQGGKRDVLFALEGNQGPVTSVLRRVAKRTLFDMGNYGAGLQPYFQIQKTATTAVAVLSVRRVEVEYKF